MHSRIDSRCSTSSFDRISVIAHAPSTVVPYANCSSRGGVPETTMSLRQIVWLSLLAALGFLVWQLSSLFPGQIASDIDQAYVIQAMVLIAFFSAGLVFAPRVKIGETVRNIVIWLAIAAVLIV